MKTAQRFVTCILIAALIVSVTACSKPTEKHGIELTDQAGRTVRLEKTAERVVSCYYVTTYAMLSLGLGDKLVGIEKKAETRPIYAMAADDLLSLPAVGSLKEINCEEIAALSPDLVLLPKKLANYSEALEALGIQTLMVEPENDKNLREMLTLIGRACGAEEKAGQIIGFYDEKLRGFEPQGESPSVLFFGNSSYLTAAPSGMYQNDLITLAGGTNVLADSSDTYWQDISYETILERDPDYLVIPAGASYTAEDIRKDSVLSELRAVKEGHVVSVPNTFEEWDAPIPSGVLGVLWLRSVLHPEAYSTASFRKDIVEFYETFYGFVPETEKLDSIS